MTVDEALTTATPKAERRLDRILGDWEGLLPEFERLCQRAHEQQLDSAVLFEVDWAVANIYNHIGISMKSFEVSAVH